MVLKMLLFPRVYPTQKNPNRGCKIFIQIEDVGFHPFLSLQSKKDLLSLQVCMYVECPYPKEIQQLKILSSLRQFFFFKKNFKASIALFEQSHQPNRVFFYKKLNFILSTSLFHKPCMYIAGVKRIAMYGMQIGHPSRWPKEVHQHPPTHTIQDE